MEKNKIFLSHRHSDTQSDCHRIREILEDEFGKDAVFLDIENLEPGIRFADAIEKALAESKVVLVAIGPDWYGAPDENGVTRLFQPKDWVHREVSAALARQDTRVIPLLLKGASRPTADQLPEDLQELADLQTFEISITRWKYDLGVLVEALAKLIPRKKKSEPQPTPRPSPVPITKPQKSWWAKNYLWVLGIFAVLIVLMVSSKDFQQGYEEGLNGASNIYENETSNQTDINGSKERKPIGNEVEVTSGDNVISDETLTKQEPISVQGNWIVYSNGQRVSTFVMSQYSEEIQFLEYDVNATNVGGGTGTLTGNTLYLDYYNSYYDSYGEFTLKTENGGRSWEGKMKASGSNQELTATLKRN